MTMSITKERNRFIRCSLLSDCKNVQKSALKSVNVQRTGKSILQMFAFSFFEGSHICRFLPILRPSTVPRSHFSYPKTKAFTLIISHLYLQIVTSASASVYKIEAKGKDLCEVQFFGKFIMCSNNEDTPVLIEPGETRYWVRKINPLKK